MGTRGPIGKRDAERLGHRTAAERRDTAPSGTRNPVPPPAPNPNWHPLVKSWYASVAQSGMAYFYEPSDWMQAIILGCETMDRELKEKFVGISKEGDPVYAYAPISPQALQSLLKLSAVLGLTEGDRRRLNIELTREGEGDEDAKILSIVREEEDEAFGG